MVIKSILDTDLYKFTTSYAYMKLFPDAEGTFEFCDRDKTVYDDKFLEMLRIELANLAVLKLTKDEFEFVNTEIRFIPQCYWEWLSSFKFDLLFGRLSEYGIWKMDRRHSRIYGLRSAWGVGRLCPRITS